MSGELVGASLESLVRCLQVVATHDTILEAEAFGKFGEALRPEIPFYHLALTRAESPGFFRVLAMTRGPGELALPLRARLASTPATYDKIYVRGEVHRSTSLGEGTELERLSAQFGFGSYLAVPVRAPNEPRVIAALLLGFKGPDEAAAIPEAFLRRLVQALGGSVSRGLAQRHHERAGRILEATGDAMLAWDTEGRIVDANRAAEELVGAPRMELVGTSVQELFRSVPLGSTSGQRLTLSRKDGRRIVVSATVSPVRGDPLVFAHALLRDLSEVVAAELDAAQRHSELRQLTEQHTLLLDNAPLLIFRLDPETSKVLYLNRHAEHLFGVPASRALETPDFLRQAHLDPEGALAFEEAVIVARLGGVLPPYEARLRRERGEPIIARGAVYPVLEEGARVVGIEGILLDVTSERAARSRLVQADRLATVGMLAAGVAHEINNPAAFMLLGLDVLSRTLSGPNVTVQPQAKHQLSQLVTDLRETGRRIVDIARDMRMFAAPPSQHEGRRGLVDVARVIESALTITRAQIVEKAELSVELGADLPLVAVDEGRLGQVLVNLLVNAAQAIAEARSNRGPRPDSDRVRICAWASEGYVEISVEDTGVGMTKDVIDRAFAPFFTTKRSDTGTGLGLAISKTIVEAAGGSITTESPSTLGDPVCGSRLVVRLPALNAKVPAKPDQAPVGSGVRGRVLIIEDEILLGKALADQLAELHEVLVTSGPEQALAALAEKRFDIVLCDIKMPVMSGDELYQEVARSDPEQAARFVFMTGVSFGSEVDAIVERTKQPLIEKPFPMRRLLRLIDEILSQQGALGPIRSA